MKKLVITDDEIKKALDKYTRGAGKSADNVKHRVMSRLPRSTKTPKQIYLRRVLATAASLVLLFAFFAYTPPGAVLANVIKENVIDKLFPPKEISVNPEGLEEEITHMPFIRETVDEGLADYIIYIDETNYYMTEENGADVIRPIPQELGYSRDDILKDMGHLWEGLSEEEINQKVDERIAELENFYSGLPECKIEIAQMKNISPAETAAAECSELKSTYANVTDVEKSDLTGGLYICATEGTEWDSKVKEVWFVDNQKGGTFVITSQYFLEATEGNGTRFSTMIDSFTVITQDDLRSE